jgi:hypothetical protein
MGVREALAWIFQLPFLLAADDWVSIESVP